MWWRSLNVNELLFRSFVLSLPLIIGGILHMVVVKLDLFSSLKIPIHPKWFGVNKTWRGFFVMPLATWPGVLLARALDPVFMSAPTLPLALALGLGYCLAELPNSFLKRRLGIKEGRTSEHFKWFFVVLDQADSAIGCLVAYSIFLHIEEKLFWFTAFLGTAVHLGLNVLLYKLKIRKNPY